MPETVVTLSGRERRRLDSEERQVLRQLVSDRRRELVTDSRDSYADLDARLKRMCRVER